MLDMRRLRSPPQAPRCTCAAEEAHHQHLRRAHMTTILVVDRIPALATRASVRMNGRALIDRKEETEGDISAIHEMDSCSHNKS